MNGKQVKLLRKVASFAGLNDRRQHRVAKRQIVRTDRVKRAAIYKSWRALVDASAAAL